MGLYWRKLRVDGIGSEADAASAAEGSTLATDACNEAADEPAESSSQLTYGTNTALSGNVVRGLRQRRQGSVTQKAAASSASEQPQADIMCLGSAEAAEQRSGGGRVSSGFKLVVSAACVGGRGHVQLMHGIGCNRL